MKSDLKILRIIDTLSKNYGGPANTILDSSKTLSKKGFEVDILTYDTAKNKIIKPYNIKIFNLGSNYLNDFFNFKIIYWLIKNKHNYDYFIVHGIWRLKTLLARIILKKNYFVFIHGMLDPYFASEILKRIKKRIYWNLIEKKNLIKSKSILLTSIKEKKLLKNTFVNVNGIKKKVISYGIIKPSFNRSLVIRKFKKKYPILKNEKYLIYLGRFHKKKGCLNLINAIEKLKKKNINLKVLMAGPESSYKKKLENLCKIKGLGKNIIWSKFITKDLKWGALCNSQAMILPSHGENFGVSVVESLACKTPVIITKKVNIFDEINKFRAGLVCSDNNKSLINALRKFNSLNTNQLNMLKKNSLKCFNHNFNLKKSFNGLDVFLKNQK